MKIVATALLSAISAASLTVAAFADQPTDEAAFVLIVAAAQADSAKASNDMQRGGALAKRERDVCNMMKGIKGAAKDWTGEITKLDSNSDGRGILQIKIAEGIYLQTANNDFSDIPYKTLIDPTSKLFESASALSVGQKVVFSGRFLAAPEKNNCLAELSLTLNGKLSEPEFVFRFSDIAAQ
ncbi:MAG: hypothetical protein E6Q98_19890 [Rhodospirillaceae bacterium]|nr:MAG: hypothetical protein E6Q98_19890 [Rhodospirillaceae bacterium]